MVEVKPVSLDIWQQPKLILINCCILLGIHWKVLNLIRWKLGNLISLLKLSQSSSLANTTAASNSYHNEKTNNNHNNNRENNKFGMRVNFMACGHIIAIVTIVIIITLVGELSGFWMRTVFVAAIFRPMIGVVGPISPIRTVWKICISEILWGKTGI
jgi:hypothetical protein